MNLIPEMNEEYFQLGMDIIDFTVDDGSIAENHPVPFMYSSPEVQVDDLTADIDAEATPALTSTEHSQDVTVTFQIDRQPATLHSCVIDEHFGSHEVEDDDEDTRIDSDDEDEDEDEDTLYDSEDEGLAQDITVVNQLLHDEANTYIGIASIANIISAQALRLHKNDNYIDAERDYRIALALNPYLSCRQELANILEDAGRIEEAKIEYVIAIEHNADMLAMYNLADLYKNESNSDDKTVADHATQMMIKYYAMAADNDDNEALEMLCAVAYGKDAVKFAMAYKKIIDNRADHYIWPEDDDDDNDENNKTNYTTFMRSTNTLEIRHTLQNTDTREMSDAEKGIIRDCIATIEKERSVITYTNKIALFTRLNNMTECNICYEDEKLNIDLHCGHCVCKDCYRRLVNSPCPFCRTESPYGFFD